MTTIGTVITTIAMVISSMNKKLGIVLDGFDTTVCCPWTDIRDELARFIGVSPEALHQAYAITQQARNTGTYRNEIEEMVAIIGHLNIEPLYAHSLIELNESLVRGKSSLYSDVAEFVDRCSESGVSTAILSNCGPLAATAFTAQNMYSLVDSIFLSYQLGSRKPHRSSYENVRSKMNENDYLVLIDDNPDFCLGAEQAGYEAIQISRQIKDQSFLDSPYFRQAESLTAVAEYLFS